MKKGENAMTNLIGHYLGRYHILEQLGEGGMAVVYKAFDTRLERNVAIKVILPGKEHTEKFLKRFEREAKALASLNHQNIVKVIDYGEQEGIPYLVMEYLAGGTLKQKMSGKPMPWKDSIRLLIPIANALASAHKNNIIHRDVKPANVLIAQTGETMLSDFGIAKILEAEETLDLTGTGVGVGTPEYMSPEQAQGKQVDARSDVYSLGVVFYEMLTGRKPYQADTPYAVVIKHVTEPLPNPKIYSVSLPSLVENVLFKCLSKKPENRYSDMGKLTIAFERTLNEAVEPKTGISRRSILIGVFFVLIFAGLFLFKENNFRFTKTTQQPQLQTESTGISSSTNETQSPVPLNIASTQVAIQIIPTLTITATQVLNVAYYDDFNDPKFDGTFNREKWEASNNCTNVGQSNGVLVFKNRNEGCDLIVYSSNNDFTYLTSLSWLEAKVKMENDFSGEVATQELQLNTVISDVSYVAWCGIIQRQNDTRFFFTITNSSKWENGLSDEYHQEMPTTYGEWHDIRIEIDPNTMKITCMVDNLLLGSHIPIDADMLRKAKFNLVIEAARGSDSFATSLVDDISISAFSNVAP